MANPCLNTTAADVTISELSNRNTEPQGAQTEYSKAKYYKGEIALQEFLLPDDYCIEVPYDCFNSDKQNVPVIDLRYLQNVHRAEVAQEMVDAAETCGFFTVINHGVTADLIERLETHVRRFFELPIDAKMNGRRGRTPGMCGYVAGSPMFLASRWWAESLQLDWNESRMHDVLQEALPGEADFQAFRADYHTYMNALGELSHYILSLLAEGLGLPSTAFTKQLQTGHGQGTMRFNYYPTCPRPDKVWGLVAHRDPSMLGVLYQDSVGGLQIMRNGQWLGIAPVSSSFVINVGDMLKAMSNGRFDSVLHRVVTNPTKPRLSMAFFCNTVDDAKICVAPELISEDQPANYRPFTYADYSCMPFSPTDFTSVHEYRPNRLDRYRIIPHSNVCDAVISI